MLTKEALEHLLSSVNDCLFHLPPGSDKGLHLPIWINVSVSYHVTQNMGDRDHWVSLLHTSGWFLNVLSRASDVLNSTLSVTSAKV